MMDVRFFLDTCIFVQTFDGSDPEKQKYCQALIAAALETHMGIVGHQVVQEFMEWALHKFATPMEPHDLREYMDKVLLPLNEVTPDPTLYYTGLEYAQQTGYPIGDAMILAAAIKGHCRILYSTRFDHGQRVGNLIIRKPFVA